MARVYGSESQPAPKFDWGGLTPRDVEELHQKDDVDTRPESHHHTIGPGPNQAAPGSLVARVDALDGRGEGGSSSGGEVSPPGVILMYAGATAPTGWGLCDGTAISRAENPRLFSAIGTTYGPGDGSTTFAKPNLKGRIPVGLDSSQTEFDTLAETGGAKTHALTTGEMPSHSHNVGFTSDDDGVIDVLAVQEPSGSTYSGWALSISDTGDSLRKVIASSEGSGNAHNNLQPYIVINYIIKLG